MTEAQKQVKIIPPNSKESEMMTLGCMMTNQSALEFAADFLDEDDFYYDQHRWIFGTLTEAYRQNRRIDVHLACEELKRQGKLGDCGGVPYIISLAQYAGISSYVSEYCEVIKQKSILRRMLNVAQRIQMDVLDEPKDALSALDDAQKRFHEINQQSTNGCGKLIGKILSGEQSESGIPFLEEVELRRQKYVANGGNELGITGIPTHFTLLDRMLSGLNPSHLIIVAGRPSMGKTAFALAIAENVCFREQRAVAIFSCEMSAQQLTQRLVCSHANVPSDKIKTGSISIEESYRLATAVRHIDRQPLLIDDQPNVRINELRARARRMKQQHGIDLIIIDYLQLLTGSNRHSENRQQEISEISRLLKSLARELDIPIICLSQLSRKVEDRPDKRPMMSDLRESGSIEQDADAICLLLRPEYYDKNNRPGMAELIVAKNRHGSVGSFYMLYNKDCAQFANYVPPPSYGSM